MPGHLTSHGYEVYLGAMTHAPIIDLWPSLSEFAADIRQSYNTAKAIRRRGFIPDWYWGDVVEAAKRREIDGVTLERLAEIAKSRAPATPELAAGDAAA